MMARQRSTFWVLALARALRLAPVPALTLLIAQPVAASGFHVDEQDARATGRAGAVTANPENASAIHYNPAGIAGLDGLRVDLGTALVRPSIDFTSASTAETVGMNRDVFVLPQGFVSLRANELVAAGVGVTAPFGFSLDWPEESPGRSLVRQMELQTLFVSPTVGLNLSRWIPGLMFAGGIDLVPAELRLARDVAFGEDFGAVDLTGSAFGGGGRAGLIYRPEALGWLSLGITYRTEVNLDFEGDGDFDAPAIYRGNLSPDGEFTTELTLPRSIAFGVMVEPLPGWEIEVDGNWYEWSSYDELEIRLPNGQVSGYEKDWNDSWTVRVGTEYRFLERYSARLGGVWDETPIPATTLDFQLPDADRIDITAGFGALLTPNLHLDLAGLYVIPRERETATSDPFDPPIKGTFDVAAWLVQLSLGMQFDMAYSASREAARAEQVGSAK